VVVAYQVYWYIYNLYFHPLARFPGPRLWAASRIPHELAYTRGRIVKELSALHEKYGDVVRVSPTSLSFGHPDAWLDIYTHKAGKTLFPKDPTRYTRDLWINGEPEVFTAPDSEHTRLRRVLAPAFSDRAIREQETLIQAHVNLLIKGLKGLAQNSETKGNADLSTWLNWATFDITGDLAFGEPFGCLEEGKYHPWVALVFESVWAVSIMGAIKQFPWLNFAFESLMGGVMRRTLTHHAQLAIEKVDRRLAKKEGRGDFLDAIMKHSGSEKEFTQGEIYSNANLLIMAGSETSAAAMSGCLYHLATNPQVLRRLTDEIRGKFPTEQDITFEAAVNLKYMTAVLQESMRLYPAQPIFTPRKVPKGGAMVAGHPVPQDVSTQPCEVA
jgi:cytochrome P450